MTNQIDSKTLSYKINIHSVTREIEDGWTNSSIIAKNIVGTDTWEALPSWDKKILAAQTHKIIIENENLRKIYFS